jgi:hypothetical protein
MPTRGLRRLVCRDRLGAIEFSLDRKRLATVGWVPGRGRRRDYEVQIWNVEALRSTGEVTPDVGDR